MKKVLTILSIFALSITNNSLCQEITKRIVAENIQVPWEMRWGPDNHIWVTGIDGILYRLHPDTGQQDTIISSLPDFIRYSTNEPGLLGFDIINNTTYYSFILAYTALTTQSNVIMRVVRYDYELQSKNVTYRGAVIDSIPAGFAQVGCRIKMYDDSLLLITIGDGGIFDPNPAQDLQSYAGKTLRLKLDGSIPNDNPFPGNAIWSWGHRNHQGLCMTKKGTIFSTEHGTQGNDEINIIKKGGNYGWPFIEGKCDSPPEEKFCQDSQVVEPIRDFTPSIAPAGIEYYDGSIFTEWKNSLLVASLRAPFFSVFRLNESEDLLSEWQQISVEQSRLRSICVSPEGRVFLGKSQGDHYGTRNNKDNAIIEILPQKTSINDDNIKNKIPRLSRLANQIIIENAANVQKVEIMTLLGEKILYSNAQSSDRQTITLNENYSTVLFILITLDNLTQMIQKLPWLN